MNARAYKAIPSPSPEADRAWRAVTAADVRKAIDGTLIGDMVNILQSVTVPPLPLELTLPKALALAGCGMSQPDQEIAKDENAPPGIHRSRFRIATAGGQSCNVWSLIVALSGTGKDIGNLADNVASLHGLHVGTSGSAEGLADAFTENGAGLLMASEFAPYMDAKAWQHHAADFLTHAWNKGHFRVNLSKRSGNTSPRESKYCYPSIVANIQPRTFTERFDMLAVESGFLGRFLVSYMPDGTAHRPRCGAVDMVKELDECFLCFLRCHGVYTPPEGYLGDVLTMFVEQGAEYPAAYSRLVNEYGPRFACMLACKTDGSIRVEPHHWDGAAVLVQWFYSKAEALFGMASGSPYERKREDQLDKLASYIKGHSPCLRSVLSQRFSRGTTATERDRLCAELAERGRILVNRGEGGRVEYVHLRD